MDKKDKDLYDIVMQVEREDNLRLIAQDERERQQFGDRSYLDVALEACDKFNQEFEGTFDGPEQITETSDNSTADELKVKYNLQDDNVISRLISLRESIKTKKQKSMSNDELILFLQSAMNYDDMQIWLMEMQFQNVQLTLDEELKKLFELKTEDDILRLYDIEQNYNENNINNIRKMLNDDIEEDSDLHLGLIEEDEEDIKDYNRPKVLKKRNIKKILDDDIED